MQTITIVIAVELTFRVIGIMLAIHSIMHTRTSQGSIAWTLALVLLPIIGVPLYMIFGRNRFEGYAELMHSHMKQYARSVAAHRKLITSHQVPAPKVPLVTTLSNLLDTPFTSGNTVNLLVDGDATFSAIKSAIYAAKHTIHIQFYTVRDDGLGQEIKALLIEKARQGLYISFVYDNIGSHHLNEQYIQELQDSGVHIASFRAANKLGTRFQINFRNHRKIVIIDGDIGFVGGLNVGDEYLGKSKYFGHWRDTFVKLTGPAVLELQVVHGQDFLWAANQPIQARWPAKNSSKGNDIVGIMATGPADIEPKALLSMTAMINRASKRLWIASPYFVPEETILSALHLACLRGVDARIMVPQKRDHFLVGWCIYAYYPRLRDMGVTLYRYQDGFMHQKVVLVDDTMAAIGTTNLDSRSLRINFEVMAAFMSKPTIKLVADMLEADMQQCRVENTDAFDQFPFWKRVMIRVIHWLEPVL